MGSMVRAWLLASLVFALPAFAELNLELVEPGGEMPLKAKPETGVKVRAGGGQGGTAMHWMAFNGDEAGVRRLIVAGAEIDDRLKTGGTPLHLAAYKGHIAVVKLLVEHGASVNARTKAGITPLDWARRNGHERVAMLLVAHGGKASKASSSRPPRSIDSTGKKDRGKAVQPAFSARRKAPLRYNLYLIPQDSVVVNQGASTQAPAQAKAPARQQQKENAPVQAAKPVKAPVRVGQAEVAVQQQPKEKSPVREKPKAETQARTKQAEPKGAYRIQLGAFSSEQRARDAWDLFRKKHPEILGSRELILDSASVKGKSFYRVQAGPMSKSDARSVCERLKKAGQTCAVKRRTAS